MNSNLPGSRITRRGLLGAGAAAAASLAIASPARAVDQSLAVPLADGLPSTYLFTDATMLFATVPLNPIGFADWLPPGLALSSPPRATCFIADYPQTSFGSVYREAAVLVHVTDARGAAYHCPWMVVDDDTALAYGRELLGFPKKLARISIERTAGGMVGSATRKGVKVLEISAATDSFLPRAGQDMPRFVNAFGSVIGGMHLLEIGDISERTKTRSVGPAQLSVGASERDPLGMWLFPGAAEGVLANLDYGMATDGVTLGARLPDAWAAVKTFQRGY